MNNFNYMGCNKNRNYFEGWYFKVLDDKNSNVYAFIFGISLYENDQHAFIQIINNKEKDSYYYRFDVNDMYYNKESIKIKDNILGLHEIKIKAGPFDINLNIKAAVELKKYGLTNSAMGCFKYLPLCTYHEIIFMNSKVEGTININGNEMECRGTGYMEKNYGKNSPKEWLWLQTNHFETYNASLTLAVADIFGKTKGFFCILNVDDNELRFATYNCSKIEVNRNDDGVKVVIDKNNLSLIIEVKQNENHTIIGPTNKGQMNREIEESLASTLSLYLYENGKLAFKDNATNVSCENLYLDNSKEKTS